MPDPTEEDDWRIIRETTEALRKRKAELDAAEQAKQEGKESPPEWVESAKQWRAEREKEERAERDRIVHINAAKKKGPDEAEKLEPYDFSSWDDEPVPQQEWTLWEKIPRRQTTLFSGEGAAGKSTIGLHLCVAHVVGKDCLQSIAEQGPAFFIDAEDEIGVIHRRLAPLTDHYSVKFSDLVAGGLHLFPLAGKNAVMANVGKGGVILPTDLYNQILGYAVRLKPQCIVIASSANVYAGSEIDRPQVTHFISLLTRLAIAANGSVVLISHPSLTGITTDTGLSGSTQWHNAVRARLLLKTLKQDQEEDAPPRDIGLRLLECKKNQYGPPSASITLQYQRGLFLPRGEPSMFEKAAKEAKADDLFLKYGKGLGGNLSPKPGKNYAPAILATIAEVRQAKMNKSDLERAMHRLLMAKKITVEAYGPPSQRSEKLIFP